jgi:hypothetical protein
MSFAEFRDLVAQGVRPPEALGGALLALWHDGRGDWDAAHVAAQEDKGRDGAWVHAYLHRKEGDPGNAGYWYARAARPMPESAVLLDTEWEEIATALLAKVTNGGLRSKT